MLKSIVFAIKVSATLKVKVKKCKIYLHNVHDTRHSN